MVYLLFFGFLFYGESKAYYLEPMQNDDNLSNKSFIIEPSKSLIAKLISDPSLFLSQVSNFDPVEVRKIIALVQNLKSTSLGREKHLVDTLETIKKEVVEAGNAVTEADIAVTNAETVVSDAQDVVIIKEQMLTTAQGIYAAKIADQNVAQKEHDDEIDSLNEEQSVLSNVIEMLENQNAKQFPNGNLVFNEDNWIFDNVHSNNGVVTGNVGFAQTKATFHRPLEVSFTSRQVDGNPECVGFSVFPQSTVLTRDSGYFMGYGWWGKKLSYGVEGKGFQHEAYLFQNEDSSHLDDGDTFQNHVYKMQLLSSGVINFYQDDKLYSSIDDSKYQSGKIQFGGSCVNWEVSAVSIKELEVTK